MACINVTNVSVLDNPSMFTSPFSFEISFECLAPLKEDLEWKIIYVGSAESEKYDQVLDSILLGPVPMGSLKFVFQADPPDLTKIPESDVLGVTVVLLTCSYKGKEFIRVGFYVNNAYETQEVGPDGEIVPIPLPVDITKVHRSILSDKPRVTRFPIEWDSPTETMFDANSNDASNSNAFLPPSEQQMSEDPSSSNPVQPMEIS
eukprot:GILJ01013016.1.p1 GENE.GILJ01013016.1~~GILJ01013016.1.p1  ORF type:complete len:227 (+),score=28.42 GILJ01013016.1:70-681(+)